MAHCALVLGMCDSVGHIAESHSRIIHLNILDKFIYIFGIRYGKCRCRAHQSRKFNRTATNMLCKKYARSVHVSVAADAAPFAWLRQMMKIYVSSQAKETFAILARNHTHTWNYPFIYPYTQGWNDENIKTNQKWKEKTHDFFFFVFVGFCLFSRFESHSENRKRTNALMALRKFDFLPWAKLLLLLLLLCTRPTIRQQDMMLTNSTRNEKKETPKKKMKKKRNTRSKYIDENYFHFGDIWSFVYSGAVASWKNAWNVIYI